MSGYTVLETGAPETWKDHEGGPRPGKRFVEKDLGLEFIGLSENAVSPGGEAPFWHTHSTLEELYVFLSGSGQMALDDDVVDVQAGTMIRVGTGVWRLLRCRPDSPEDLRYLCVRAGGDTLGAIGHDGQRDDERARPWA